MQYYMSGYFRGEKKKRCIYLLSTALLFFIELCIALFVRDAFVRPYVGDMLVVLLIYTAVRILIPSGIRLLPLYVFFFAAFVEGLQGIRIVELLGLQENRFFRVLIGSTFDWKDIIGYGVGCILLGIYEYRVWKSETRKNENE